MRGVWRIDEMAGFAEPCVLAVGIFDGLHLGHRKVLECAKKTARAAGALAGALTFDPHPSRVISTGRPPVDMIFPPEQRAGHFLEAGLGAVFFKRFDRDFADLPPEGFAGFLGEKFPNLRGIVTGENFLFGRGAVGDSALLRRICRESGWKYRAVGGLFRDGERVSSTRLRRCLSEGDMPEYARLAGGSYAAEGAVEGGKRLGREIGFPTLNLPWEPECRPPYGVYAARVLEGGRAFEGVANYGVAPSAGELARPVVEANLFETPDFGTGAKIRAEFLKFLRPEKKFESLDALKTQIAEDRAAARAYFAKSRRA